MDIVVAKVSRVLLVDGLQNADRPVLKDHRHSND